MKLGEEVTLNLLAKVLDGIEAYTIVVAKPTGDFIYWNEAAYELFMKNHLKSTKENWAEDFKIYYYDRVTPYHTEDIPLVRALKGERCKNQQMYLQRKDQDGVYLNVSSYPIKDEQGVIQYAVAMCEDVSAEQKSYTAIMDAITALTEVTKREQKVNQTKTAELKTP